MLDEEGSHLGEDYRIEDGAEPDGKEAKNAFYFFNLGDGAEAPWVRVGGVAGDREVGGGDKSSSV